MAKRVELPEFLADRLVKSEERLLHQFEEIKDVDENDVTIEVRDGQEFVDPNRRDDDWYEVLWEVRTGRGKPRYFALKRPYARDTAWESIVAWRAWSHAAELWRSLAKKVDWDIMAMVAKLIEAVSVGAWAEGVTEKVEAQMVDTMEAVREEIDAADADLQKIARSLSFTKREPAPPCPKCGAKMAAKSTQKDVRYVACGKCGHRMTQVRRKPA